MNTPEILRINGMSFFRVKRETESHLWNAMYLSEPLREIQDDKAIFAYLLSGPRGNDTAWTARLYVGDHCLFNAKGEYNEAKDAVERIVARLEGIDGIDVDETEHARELLGARSEQCQD